VSDRVLEARDCQRCNTEMTNRFNRKEFNRHDVRGLTMKAKDEGERNVAHVISFPAARGAARASLLLAGSPTRIRATQALSGSQG
jgi:hypothetical protein